MITSKQLTTRQKADWSKHVVACFPEEACAYIVNGRIFPVPNVSDKDRKTHFAVSVMDRFEANRGKITGFLHSHAMTSAEAGKAVVPPEWPSNADMRGWMNDDTRWGISVTDGVDVTEPIWMDEAHIAPLEGRVFIHGIWDCYALVRDWFRVEKGITLKNYAREVEWHLKGEDLYMKNFKEAGFARVEGEEVVSGDVVLMTLNSKGVVCHAGVVVDATRMLHHTYSRTGQALSGYVDRGRWAKHVAGYVRYTPSLNRDEE